MVFNKKRSISFTCNDLVLVVAMVGSIIMLSAKTKNYSFYIRTSPTTDAISEALVAMVCMVAIARCFGVSISRNQQQTQALDEYLH